ncbi:MAG: hypothetical protein AAFU55_10695 [Pseudomonadota bacterium]
MLRPIAMAVLLASAGTASAGEKAALVIDIVGASTPVVDPFSELEAGDTVDLGADSELIVMHYATCEEIHIASGGVTVGRDAVTIDPDAEVIARDKVSCPASVAFREDANAAGAVVLRSAGDAVIAPRPVFVAPGADRVEVLLGDRLIASAPVSRGRALWPAEAPDLMVGETYALRMTGPGGDKAAAATVRGDAGVAILRYE